MIREEASEPFRAERVPISHRLGLGLGLCSRRFSDSDWRGDWNGMAKTLNCADYDEDDPKRKSSRPSAEEGHRLVRLFLSVERADLREEIFHLTASGPRPICSAPASRFVLANRVALTAGARGAIISAMDLIKNILFFVALTAIICAIMLFEIRSERRRFFEPAPSSPRLHQS
jgi:hypothetical protein